MWQDERSREDCWDLIYHGKEIKKEVLQKRYWLKKNLLTELRAGRPYSMRDALLVKLGVFTNVYLSSQAANKNQADKARRKSRAVNAGRSPIAGGKGGTQKHSKLASDDDDDDDDDDEDDET